MNITWEDTNTYSADRTVVNGHLVVVCLDDEGPMRPAYYWEVDPVDKLVVGWSASVEQAKRDAVKAAEEIA